MKNGANYKFSRRNFIKGTLASLVIVPFLNACRNNVVKLMVLMRLTGPKHLLGHRLWAKNFPKPTNEIQVKYLIIGGGISGLSAARRFSKRGENDFLLLEMEDHIGGNSSNGENKYSKFPLGAHYLPFPNLEDKELLDFLSEEKIITSFDAEGLPVFDEFQVAFDPDERLYYKNTWQEGIIPKLGNSDKETNEFNRFFKQMELFRNGKGKDGKYLFNIPLSKVSDDNEIRNLDQLTMLEWLNKNNYSIPPLLEYIDYCCRDDYGLSAKWVSAWAGIHYFAARKHNASLDLKDKVLTWPEGNARLASHLRRYSINKTALNKLVYELKIVGKQVKVKVFDAEKNSSFEVLADKVILACPQFINQYLIENRKELTQHFHYTPWLLASLTLTNLDDNHANTLCWDNVIHGAKGLGYIYDQHMSVAQVKEKTVITYYCSFPSDDARKTRRELHQKTVSFWNQFVLDDLKIAHPDIESAVEEIEIHLLGHGMISPVPGFIFGKPKTEASKNIENKIFFAHTDLSGISIFEEAFHQGIEVVDQILSLEI